MPSLYEEALSRGDDAVRTTILDAASGLLGAEGPQALGLRRIAAAVGCSTTVLYRMFGNKAGLVEALYVEAFDRFGRRMAAVPLGDDPVEYLRQLGIAYRRCALVDRHYYRLMFGEPIPGFTPSDEAVEKAAAAFSILEEAVAACETEGRRLAGSPGLVARSLWAYVHGVVSLELAGHLHDAEAAFDLAMRAIGTGVFGTEPSPQP